MAADITILGGIEGLRDTALGEAITTDSGRMNILALTQIVGGYRRSQLRLDERSSRLIDITDELTGKECGWGEYAQTIGGLAQLDVYVETVTMR